MIAKSLPTIIFMVVSSLFMGRLDAAEKPNILFIFADDWGWGDLSCQGHPWLKTPNIDRLASEGTDFQQFNVLNPPECITTDSTTEKPASLKPASNQNQDP